MTEPTADEVRDAWDRNAGFWDGRMSAPDSWQQTMVFPALERLLELRPGERVLDVGCGNGLLARRLAEAGASVIAVDFSEEQLRLARGRVEGLPVDVRGLDATDEAALRGLGDGFDAVTASMALMDISDVEPLASALPRLLVPGGRFVFTVLHPAFNNLSTILVTEVRPEGTAFVAEHAVKVSSYARPRAGLGVGVPGQPVEQWYFDRSLSDLLRPFLAAGLVLDGLDEPVFDPEAQGRPSEQPVWSQVPPILAARLRSDGAPPRP